MKLSAALDTSTSKTAVCVVNSRDGSVVFEATVATDPAVIFGALAPFLPRLDRVGHEAAAWRRGCIASSRPLAYPWYYWRPGMRRRR
jgi:hypothetical protein